MFTKKDIEFRSIFLINCFEKKHLRLRSGELLLENDDGKTLTKFPFQKILALFVIGNCTITTPLLDKCRKYGIFVSVMRMNLRPVFTFGNNAEANFIVRERQFAFDINNISIAKHLIIGKITNQKRLLEKTRKRDDLTLAGINAASVALDSIGEITSYKDLMGMEGWVAKYYFAAYFQDFEWCKRMPRTKIDALNVLLDIGYTMMFNFLESYLRLFGFDIYIGVYHRCWFKRKSLICDVIEPFRCIVDVIIRKSLNLKQFKPSDFKKHKNEYYLDHSVASDYYKILMAGIVEYKKEIFQFVQGYYRYFMNPANSIFPKFLI